MKELKTKKQKSLDTTLDADTSVLSGISILITIGVFVGVVIVTVQTDVIIWFSLIAGLIAAFICFMLFSVCISYLRVQAEILRTLKRIESKNE